MLYRGRGRALSAIVLLSTLVALTVVSVSSVFAHAYLVDAEPTPGSTLALAPTRLRLTFSEHLESAFSQVRVLNASREAVDRGDSSLAPDDSRVMLVSLQSGLSDGFYTVAWRTLSADDGHSESGAYTLVVGVAAGAPGVVQSPSSQPEFAVETALGRWWLYVAASLVFGSLLAWQIVFRPLHTSDGSAARTVAITRTKRLVVLGAIALVVGTLYGAVAQAASASGLPVWSVFGRPLQDMLTGGHYASIWWPRLSLSLVCLALLLWRGIDGLAGDLVLALLPAILLTSSLGTHAASVPGWSALAIAADWLHFMAVTAWLGGLASMVFVLPAVMRAGGTSGPQLFTRPVRRFSNVALVCTAAVATTGSFQAWLQVGSWPALMQTAYGLSVSAKVALTVLMLGFGAFNLFLAWPRLARLAIPRIARIQGVVRAFHRSVRTELVLGVVVLGVAAVLTGLAPGRGDLAHQSSGQPGPIDRRLETQALAPRVRISPATVGENHFGVALSEVDGAQVERVQLTLTYLDGDLGSAPLALQPSASTSGLWESDSAALSQPGQWQADLLVRRQGQDDVRSTMRFTVVAVPSATRQPDLSGAYPPVPTWLPPALGGAAAVVILCVILLTLVSRRTTRRQTPLEPESLRAVLRGSDPIKQSDDDSRQEAVGAGQARRSAQRAMREKGSGE